MLKNKRVVEEINRKNYYFFDIEVQESRAFSCTEPGATDSVKKITVTTAAISFIPI